MSLERLILVPALIIYDGRRMYKHDLSQMTGRFIQYKILEAILVEHHSEHIVMTPYKMIFAQERMSGIRLKN